MTDEQIVSFIKTLLFDQRKTIEEIASQTKVSVRTMIRQEGFPLRVENDLYK